jgi:hypothetical protein
MTEYRFRPGYRAPAVDANTIGAVKDRILEQHGHCSAELFLEYATPEESETHPMFEWDDGKAGHQHRLSQSRAALRNLVIVYVGENGQRMPMRSMIHVKLPETGHTYVPVVVAMRDEELREQILGEARKGLEGWRHRYDELSALTPEVLDTVDQLIEELRLAEEKRQKNEARAIARRKKAVKNPPKGPKPKQPPRP